METTAEPDTSFQCKQKPKPATGAFNVRKKR